MMYKFVQAETSAHRCSCVCSMLLCRCPAGAEWCQPTHGPLPQPALREMRRATESSEAPPAAWSRKSLFSTLSTNHRCCCSCLCFCHPCCSLAHQSTRLCYCRHISFQATLCFSSTNATMGAAEESTPSAATNRRSSRGHSSSTHAFSC
jgi:hypothetical protein